VRNIRTDRTCQKRPKETYYTCIRDLLYMQKRPTIHVKETYYICKRDLLYMQNRPTIYAKETWCAEYRCRPHPRRYGRDWWRDHAFSQTSVTTHSLKRQCTNHAFSTVIKRHSQTSFAKVIFKRHYTSFSNVLKRHLQTSLNLILKRQSTHHRTHHAFSNVSAIVALGNAIFKATNFVFLETYLTTRQPRDWQSVDE